MKDRNGIELEVGHICKVHVSDRLTRYLYTGNMFSPQSKNPYYVEIIPYEKKSGDMGYNEKIMTNIPGKHGAWINPYLLSKLEVIGTKDTHDHLLFNQFEDQEIKIEVCPF